MMPIRYGLRLLLFYRYADSFFFFFFFFHASLLTLRYYAIAAAI